MNKDDMYYFHQTPNELAKELINFVSLKENDLVLEPFKGEGAFYSNFPSYVSKHWCEITEGRDFKDYKGEIDWVISNPPFRLENEGKRENAFWKIIKHFMPLAKKGIAFLGNDYCLSTLTPKRLEEMAKNGFYITGIIVCSVKAWRGRYFFIIIEKGKEESFYKYLLKSY